LTGEEAIRRLFEGWERGDADAVADLFTDDGIYEDPLKPATLKSREEIREKTRTALSRLDDCRITVGLVASNGDVCFVEGEFRSVLRESGARKDFRFAALVEMRDGRIARLAEYFDTRPLA